MNKNKNKTDWFNVFLWFVCGPLMIVFYVYWKAFILPPILKERDYKKYVSEYVNKTSEVSLYPGYLIKEKGRIFWCSKRPILNDGGWAKINPIEVTDCVFDPFPYTSGDEKSLLEIKAK
jgi:hypothetical protein